MNDRRFRVEGGAILAIGFFVLFVGGGGRHAIGLVFKPMVEDLNWERGALGMAVGLFFFVSAVCTFFAGHLADRIPLRTVLGGGLVISAGGISLMGLVSAPWQAVILYGIAFAVGNGAVSIAPIGVMVTRRFPGRIGLANAIAISGIGLGQLVIITVLAAMLVAIGWQSVFAGLAVINLVLVPVVIWALKNEGVSPIGAGDTETSSAISLGKIFAKPYFWLLLGTYAVCGFQDFFVATHVVAFALDTGVAPLLAGNLLAFLGLAGVLGVIAAGASSDRFGPIAAMLICFTLRIAIFALVLIDKGTMSVTLFAVLYGFTFWTTAPLTVVFVRQAFGHHNLGAISGLVTMVHQIFGGIGAWLGAANFDARGDYDVMFMVMIGISVTAIGLTVGLARGAA